MTPRRWTISALSVELGIDRRTLARRLEGLDPIEEKVVGQRTERTYRMRDVFKHLSALEQRPSLDDERRKLTILQQERLRIEIEAKQGSLIDLQVAREEWGDACRNIRQRLLAIPSRVAPLMAGLDAPSARDILDSDIRRCLVDLARGDLTARVLPGQSQDAGAQAAELDDISERKVREK